MESKKINQLATNVAPQTSDLTIIGDPITGISKKITLLQIANLFATTGTVTSVAVTETGDALTITGSPITSAGTINIGFAGDATQYVRGDGALADFPTSTGGGSSVSYYLNSSVSQGTIGGVAYRELSKDPIAGAGTDITISADGYIASYITDANDPALLEVPGGNFNCEFYFSVNSDAHNPYVYAELYKYDGTTFTLLGSSQSVPEYLSNGTTLSPYYFAIPVAASALTITDRLAIRIYANVDTRTVTLHTENNHLCQVVTTFSKGLTSLNNLTRQVQFFGTGTSGTDFAISSSTATHTFNLPVASATNTGKLSSTDWSTFNNKQPAIGYTPANDSLVVHLAGTETITGDKTYSGVNTFDTYQTRFTVGIAINQTLSGGAVGSHTVIGANVNGLNVNFPAGGYNSLNFASTSVGNTYTFPNATGTIALTSQLTGGTVTSVAALTIGTTGTDLSSSVANGTTTPVITLNVPTASATNRGVVTAADWSTFANKQDALNGTGFIKISGTTISYDNSTYLTTSAAASTYLPLAGGSLTGALNINTSAGSGLNVASDSVIFRSNTGVGSPRQVEISMGGGSSTFLDAKGYGANYITDFGIRTYNSAGAAFNVFFGTSAGSVGINTTSPNLAGVGRALSIDATTQTIIELNNSGARAGYLYNDAAATILGEARAIPLLFRTQDTERMRITSDGNVGIGTTSPTSYSGFTTLNINNSVNGGVIDLLNNGTRVGSFLNTSTDVQLGTITSVPLILFTANSERMRITSVGKLLVGTSTAGYGLFTEQRMTLNPTNDGITVAPLTQNKSAYTLQADNNTGNRYGLYIANGSSSEVGSVSFTSSAVSFNTTSDYRLKQDLKEFKGLDLISAINTYDFEWKIDGTRSYGVIAHELQEVIPYVVIGDKDGEKLQSVDYSKLVPILIKSIQELQAKIVTLESKIK